MYDKNFLCAKLIAMGCPQRFLTIHASGKPKEYERLFWEKESIEEGWDFDLPTIERMAVSMGVY